MIFKLRLVKATVMTQYENDCYIIEQTF